MNYEYVILRIVPAYLLTWYPGSVSDLNAIISKPGVCIYEFICILTSHVRVKPPLLIHMIICNAEEGLGPKRPLIMQMF